MHEQGDMMLGKGRGPLPARRTLLPEAALPGLVLRSLEDELSGLDEPLGAVLQARRLLAGQVGPGRARHALVPAHIGERCNHLLDLGDLGLPLDELLHLGRDGRGLRHFYSRMLSKECGGGWSSVVCQWLCGGLPARKHFSPITRPGVARRGVGTSRGRLSPHSHGLRRTPGMYTSVHSTRRA